mmetsp:Transcript_13902/g.30129  ORF Transcript_13902/g.30129 Transcript_13902/m.30129 type:complete len:238 (+) Transcript_13902:158-871(+)
MVVGRWGVVGSAGWIRWRGRPWFFPAGVLQLLKDGRKVGTAFWISGPHSLPHRHEKLRDVSVGRCQGPSALLDIVDNAPAGGFVLVAAVRYPSCRELPQNDRKREHIGGLCVVSVVIENLGSDPQHGPPHRRMRCRCLRSLPKVPNLGPPIEVDKHVETFQVAMQQAAGVNVHHPLGYLYGEAQAERHGELGRLVLEESEQRPSRHPLCNHTPRRDTHTQQLNHIGMPQTVVDQALL